MRRDDELASIALATVSAAAAAGLARVFADGSFAPLVLGAALVPHAVGFVARRHQLTAATHAVLGLGACLLYFSWAAVPATTWFGIPTAETITALAHRLDDGWHVLRTGVAPVPVTGGAPLLAAVAVAAAAQCADVLAARRMLLSALVPSLFVFVIASTLGTEAQRTRTTLVYAAAALAFLLLTQRSELERGRSWFTGRRVARRAGPLGVGATFAVVALGTGLVIGPALPGADSGPLLDYRGLGTAGGGRGPAPEYVTVSPLVDIKGRLTGQDPRELFRVHADRESYWRIAALDQFDGEVWGVDGRARRVDDALDATPPPNALEQRYRIGPLGDRWLPAALEPVASDLADARIIEATSTVVSDRDSISGLTYTVWSVEPLRPQSGGTEQDRETAPGREPAGATVLPADLPPRVAEEATRVTRGTSTPLEQALALEAWFRSDEFAYDLDVPGGHGQDAIVAFLEARRGYCEQFAGTFAAMARTLGIPARVAVGFTPGTRDGDWFVVTGREAHAWPEVWLGAAGWVRFEPTPPGGDAAGGSPDEPLAPPTAADPATEAPSPTTVPAEASPNSGETSRTDAAPEVRAGPSPDRPPALAISGVAAVVGAATAIGTLSWAIAVVVRKRRLRARRRAAPEPLTAIGGAWADTLDRLREAGVAPHPADTPRELATRSGRHLPDPVTEPLGALAETYTAARFSGRACSPADAGAAWSQADAVLVALDAAAPRRQRWRRRLDPGPGPAPTRTKPREYL